MSRAGKRSGRRSARIGAILALGLALAVLARGQSAAPSGGSPQTAAAPAVDVEGDWLITPDGRLRRPEVAKPALPKEVTRAFIIPIKQAITGATLDAIRRKIIPIKTRKAQIVIFDMDTPGGSGGAMAGIVRLIMQDLKDIYTVAYVNPDALSAGAIISVACDEIVMAPAARIGAAMPILIAPTGQIVELPEKVRGKFESADLAGARAMADRNGYDNDLIEGMITIDRVIWLIRRRGGQEPRELQIVDAADWYGRVADVPPGRQPVTQRAVPTDAQWEYVRTIAGPNKLVTLTANEAVAYGLATRVVDSMEQLRQAFNITAAPEALTDTWSERMVGFLTSPAVMVVLLFVGILALYLEINTPGFGVPGTIAIICFAILFGSRYLAGLAQVWEIALFVLGVGLLLVEIFVTPGFGVMGIAGILCCLAALLAIAMANPPDKLPLPDTELDWSLLTHGAMALVAGVTLAVVGAAILARYLPRVPVASRLVLAPPQAAAVPPATEDANILDIRPGQTGEVVQICRPVGKVRIGERLMDAIADGAFLNAGTRVVVLRNEGNRLVVEEKT